MSEWTSPQLFRVRYCESALSPLKKVPIFCSRNNTCIVLPYTPLQPCGSENLYWTFSVQICTRISPSVFYSTKKCMAYIEKWVCSESMPWSVDGQVWHIYGMDTCIRKIALIQNHHYTPVMVQISQRTLHDLPQQLPTNPFLTEE